MGHALFYRLGHSSVADLVRSNATRALAMGWRVAVRGRDRASLAALDEALWRDPADSFLPHGLAGGPFDADQPVLLSTDSALPNGARALVVLDGVPVSAAEIAGLERCWIVFDGTDPLALQVAREQWRQLTAEGAEAEFWSESSGAWRKEADNRRPAE